MLFIIETKIKKRKGEDDYETIKNRNKKAKTFNERADD